MAMRSTLCVLTVGPASRVYSLLTLWRPLVDQIVLAVDTDGDVRTLEACGGLADKRFAVEMGRDWNPERPFPWLLQQCDGEWMLWFDDDEIPSAALLRALPELLEDPALRCIHTPMLWLFPDERHYIAQAPWAPCWQARIVRNQPGRFICSGAMHASVQTMGPRRFGEHLPLYHANLLLLPLEARRRKANRYERLRPGHNNSGFPVNAMYTPEDCGGVESRRVPNDDRDLIMRVLTATDPRAGVTPRSPVRRVSNAEIASCLPTRGARTAFRARRFSSKLFRVLTKREPVRVG